MYKRLIIALSLVMFISLGVSTARHLLAQEKVNRFHRIGLTGEPGIGDLEEILSLTSAQKEKIQQIFKNHRAGFKRERGEKSHIERRKDHDSLRAVLYEEIIPVLNEEQQQILSGIKSEYEAGRVPGIVIDIRVNRLNRDLELTEAQSEKLKEVFSEFGEKLISIRKSENPERGEVKELFRQMHDQLETILTPDQMDELRQFRKERGERFGRRSMRGNQQRLNERLNLTPEQEKQVKEIFAVARKDMDKKRFENRENIVKKLEDVLTEEQLEQFKSIQSYHSGRDRGGHRGSRNRF